MVIVVALLFLDLEGAKITCYVYLFEALVLLSNLHYLLELLLINRLISRWIVI